MCSKMEICSWRRRCSCNISLVLLAHSLMLCVYLRVRTEHMIHFGSPEWKKLYVMRKKVRVQRKLEHPLETAAEHGLFDFVTSIMCRFVPESSVSSQHEACVDNFLRSLVIEVNVKFERYRATLSLDFST